MGFYNNTKEDRERITNNIYSLVLNDFKIKCLDNIINFSVDKDTYIRKLVYQATGKIYIKEKNLKNNILEIIESLLQNPNELIRQTAVYSIGEIGKFDPTRALILLEIALTDKHHKVINAVIGALKQMGEKSPKETLLFAKKYIYHEDPNIRREIIHGIELRGRNYPEDVLPLLKEVQNDKVKRNRDMVVHVIGQISYKKGCLEKVINEIKTWENQKLVIAAIEEILEVHRRYEKFSVNTYDEAKQYIEKNLNSK